MERETNQDQNPPIKLNQSPRKPPPSGGGGGGGGGSGSDRLKRDEWSEGAVGSLLEAYESKWILRNRAKLKGQDWEDVARHVSSRANSSKSPKTQTQCKNKIESMKKRYRSESAANDTSSWPLFSRLDHLLRGTGSSGGPLPAQPPPLPPPPPPPPTAVQPPAALKGATVESNPGLLLLESSPVAQQLLPPQVPPPPPLEPPLPPPQPAVEIAENSQESNGVDHRAKESEGGAAKLSDQKQQDQAETDSSTPALYSNDRNDLKLNKMKMKMKVKRKRARREDGGWDDVAESVRWLAEAVVRSEQARMDTIREVERMRVEAEAKRGELDLKRTEIIASTQLEIARIFASALAGKGVDSSLRIGRS